MMRLAILALSMLMAGCVPPSHRPTGRTVELDRRVRAWIGRNINDAIRQMGAASAQMMMPNGNVLMTWTRSRQGVMSMPAFGGQGMIQAPITRGCTIQLEYDAQQTIVSARWEGNDCN